VVALDFVRHEHASGSFPSSARGKILLSVSENDDDHDDEDDHEWLSSRRDRLIVAMHEVPG
jgi:hypothetical protein